MKKMAWVWLPIVLMLTACSKHDERYYASHPRALQKAMTHCPARSLGALSCDALKVIALRINHLAYELRMNQQAYGQTILALQEKQHEYQQKLQQHPNQSEALQAFNELTQDLQERLFVVKWLESPRHIL